MAGRQFLEGVIEKVEPGYSQRCMVEGQETMGINRNERLRMAVRKRFFHSEDSQAVKQVAQRDCSHSILGGFQDPSYKALSNLV